MIARFCVLKSIRKLIFLEVVEFNLVVVKVSRGSLINYDQVFLQAVTMNQIIEFIPYVDHYQ